MKLVDEMKDEKLGCALIYNFTKGYGKVPMNLYDVVLPLLYNETFTNSINDYSDFDDCIIACKNEDDNFSNEFLKAYEDDKTMTQNALGLAMINQSLYYEPIDDVICGQIKPSSILEMNEAIRLGEMLQGKSCDNVLSLFSNDEFKIVFLDSDTLGKDVDFSPIEKCGNLHLYQSLTREEVYEVVQDAHVVMTNKIQLNEDILSHCQNIQLICVSATGVNNIDLEYCHNHHIVVSNVKGYSTDSVSQHTFALALALINKLDYYHHYIDSGSYSSSSMFSHFDYSFGELSKMTWGIVGMGDIGRKVASIASAFGCDVQYYSTSGKNNQQDYRQVDFKTLLKTSDIISIHAPLNQATENLFDEAAFILMKDNAYLINAGRGKIINETDLIKALNEKRIQGAGLDVFENEPIHPESPLLQFKDATRLIMTPHVAWAAVEARNRVLDEMAENVKSFKKGKPRNAC